VNGISVRRLRVGDEHVVERLADRTPRTALLADDRTIFLVAFAGAEPVGFVLAYEMPRRHGGASMLIVYEVDVDEQYRRRGIASALLLELERLAKEQGIAESFVLTEPDNDAANALYASLGGVRSEVIEWDWQYEED
jgi:aminoglycoside 3-N-acetyltransferase I